MKQNKTKLIETNKLLSPLEMCENWVLTLWGKISPPPKNNISSNIGELVTFQSILGSSIDLMTLQWSIGDMELATWQYVWLTIW